MADVRSTLLGVPILDEAARHSIPVVAQYKGVAKAGTLLTFAHRATDGYRRAAYYVDRILKGVKPGDLSVEQPTTFELVISLKTAKALGLTILPSVLLRADEIIE
jgi:putative tryptophan/tyrosine transport system substrate-binding protein